MHYAATPTEHLAIDALEILLERSRHMRRCRQCQLDVGFCQTAAEYASNFSQAFKRWERRHEQEEQQKGGHA
jgi:hypothetical protein